MAFLDKYRRKDTHRLGIVGMTCSSCENRVKDALQNVPGVLGAEVSHEVDGAIVKTKKGKVDRDVLVDAVKQAGYDVETF